MNLLGQGWIKAINKSSFYFFKSLFILKYISSSIFRYKTQIFLNRIEILNKRSSENFDKRLIRAVINIEDRRYFLHYGHDSPSILRAFIHNIFGSEKHGASTIEQQLIRIITNERIKTYKRKFNELLLSTLFYKNYSKKEIIQIYLAHYIFTEEKVGIELLCDKENYKFYELSEKDIYEIVARLKYPNLNQKNYINYLKRVRTIEKQLTIIRMHNGSNYSA